MRSQVHAVQALSFQSSIGVQESGCTALAITACASVSIWSLFQGKQAMLVPSDSVLVCHVCLSSMWFLGA